jgi:outer membrane protein OmpA-like peptidoglycan-associated protein
MMAIRIAVLAVLFAIPPVLTRTWIAGAEDRLEEASAAPVDPKSAPARAAASDVAYCNADLKRLLRRVLLSCGLVEGAAVRGCQPVEAKNVATLSGPDFNALFTPMKARGGIVQFDLDGAVLDDGDIAMIDQVFADQGGASWFFIVARSSPEGSVEHNRELSQARANAVLTHLKAKYPDDPDLDREVGLLWLGEEYAQLEQTSCDWKRSSAGACTPVELNRSAFITWIDCQL